MDREKCAKKKQWGGKRKGAGRPTSSTEGPTVLVAVTVPEVANGPPGRYCRGKRLGIRSEAVTQAIRGLLRVAKRGS